MAMVEKKVPYEVNGRQFEGKLVYDDSVKGKRPAVYMQPDWKGIDADTTGQAREVAGKDYVVLMADMFGKGYGDKPKTVDAASRRHARRAQGPAPLRSPAARNPSIRCETRPTSSA